MSNPIAVAEASVLTAHRRRVGRVVVMLSGAALVITIWVTAATLIFPTMRSNGLSTLVTETIPLSCLSPQQAADIIDPYVRTHGSLYFVPTSGISAITVRGTAAQLAKSRDLIREFETDPAAACRNPTAGLKAAQKMYQDLHQAAPVLAGPPSDKVPTAPKK
jgi:type II secretory pathway component GspD/PulD (secretin)